MSIWDLAKPVIAQVHGFCLAGRQRARDGLRPRLRRRGRADGLPRGPLRRPRHALPRLVPRHAAGDGDDGHRRLDLGRRRRARGLGEPRVPRRRARRRRARGRGAHRDGAARARAAQQARRAPPDGLHGHALRHPRRHRAVRARDAHEGDGRVHLEHPGQGPDRGAARSATSRSATTAPPSTPDERIREREPAGTRRHGRRRDRRAHGPRRRAGARGPDRRDRVRVAGRRRAGRRRRRAPTSRPGSSSRTRTSTARCGGTRRATRCRPTARPPPSSATAASRSRRSRSPHAGVDDRAVLLHRGPARAGVRARRPVVVGDVARVPRRRAREPGGDERRGLRRPPGPADLRHGRRRVGRAPPPTPSAPGWPASSTRRSTVGRARFLDDVHGHRPREPRGAEPPGRRRRVRRVRRRPRPPSRERRCSSSRGSCSPSTGPATSTASPRCARRTACGPTGRCFAARPGTTTSASSATRTPKRWRARGADMWPTFSGAPSYVNLHFDRSIMWHGVLAWHELVNGPGADKAALLADTGVAGPGPRRLGRVHLHAGPDPPSRSRWSCTTANASLDAARRAGRSPTRHAATGVHLSDALADWLLENGIGSSLRTAEQPMEEDAVVELVRDPHTVTGVSDAGAHIQMFNGAGNPTYMSTRYVRDTGVLTVEEIVHSFTGKHAQCFGLADRGVVAVGRAGGPRRSSRSTSSSCIPTSGSTTFPAVRGATPAVPAGTAPRSSTASRRSSTAPRPARARARSSAPGNGAASGPGGRGAGSGVAG